jgi:hypothetical protein
LKIVEAVAISMRLIMNMDIPADIIKKGRLNTLFETALP